MATNIEIEAKVLINENDYKRIIKLYNKENSTKIIQTNYYIDTDSLYLRKYGIGLRIREKGYYTLTIKAPLAEGLLERKQSITEEEFLNIKNNDILPAGEIKNLLITLGVKIEDLRIITSLVTERTEIENETTGTIFSIDKNSYNDQFDYELEMEGPSIEIARERLATRCAELDIPYVENKKSKQIRALETIKK